MGSKLSKKNKNEPLKDGQLFRQDAKGNAVPVSDAELRNIATHVKCPPPQCPPPQMPNRPYYENRNPPVIHRNYQRAHGDEMRYSRSMSYHKDMPFDW